MRDIAGKGNGMNNHEDYKCKEEEVYGDNPDCEVCYPLLTRKPPEPDEYPEEEFYWETKSSDSAESMELNE